MEDDEEEHNIIQNYLNKQHVFFFCGLQKFKFQDDHVWYTTKGIFPESTLINDNSLWEAQHIFFTFLVKFVTNCIETTPW